MKYNIVKNGQEGKNGGDYEETVDKCHFLV